MADLTNRNMEKGNKYPQVNPSQSQVSKYFFFYLNMGEVSHPLLRCTAFTTLKTEIEGDKKSPSAWNTFLSDSTVLFQGPNSFLSLRTSISLHWNHSHTGKCPSIVLAEFIWWQITSVYSNKRCCKQLQGEISSAHIPPCYYKAAQPQGLGDDISRVLRLNSFAILS